MRANPAYKAFKESVAWACKLVHNGLPIEGPVSVRLWMELNPRIDAQNVIKPVLDALEIAGIIKNDKQVCSFSFHREDRPPREEDKIGISVREIER